MIQVNKQSMEDKKYYILNTYTKIDTTNPLSNEYVKEDQEFREPFNYSFVEVPELRKSILLAGVETPKEGKRIILIDDGNETTRFGTGVAGIVEDYADNINEIKNFISGKYSLYVLK